MYFIFLEWAGNRCLRPTPMILIALIARYDIHWVHNASYFDERKSSVSKVTLNGHRYTEMLTPNGMVQWKRCDWCNIFNKVGIRRAICSISLTSKTQMKMRLMTSMTTSSDVMLSATLGSQFIVSNVSTSAAGTDWNKLTMPTKHTLMLIFFNM